MADTYTSMQAVAEDALAEFHNKLGLVASANKDVEPQFLTGEFDKGNTIKIRKPNRFTVSDGAVIASIPDTEERTVDLVLDTRKKVVMDFTTQDLTLYTKTQFKQRFIDPPVLQLANKVESDVALKLTQQVYNHAGTAGTAPASFTDLAREKAFLNKMGIPEDHMFMMQEDQYSNLISIANLQNSFLPALNQDITRRYLSGNLAGMDIMHSVLMPSHIAGIGDSTATPANGYVAAGTVKTNIASGSTSMVITGLNPTDTGTFLKGDKIKFTGYYSVNPNEIDISTSEPFQVTVTADAAAVDGSGDVTVNFYPAIISDTASPYRNVTSQILATTPIFIATANTGVGSATKVPYKTNVGFYRDAIQFAAPPLRIPKSVVPGAAGRMTDPETGISIRLIEAYDVINDKTITRFDILYGVRINGEYAVAYLG